jgi:hypothetical protein
MTIPLKSELCNTILGSHLIVPGQLNNSIQSFYVFYFGSLIYFLFHTLADVYKDIQNKCLKNKIQQSWLC